MPSKRQVVLANDEIYHVFNRSIASEEIFINKKMLSYFLATINYYRFPQTLSYSKYKKLNSQEKLDYIKNLKENSKPLVEIYAYSIMPDHYHLLLKQLSENGISKFISNIQNSFAKYFNFKSARDGGIFKSPFKSKWVSSEEIFLHLSRYIHLNPVTSYLIEIEQLEKYPWTSFKEYVKDDPNTESFINKRLILKIVGGKSNYVKFVSDRVDYQRTLQKLKTLILE